VKSFLGSHIGTVPFGVFQQLLQHPMTERGLAGFLKDGEKAREMLADI
jgi:transaldolase